MALFTYVEHGGARYMKWWATGAILVGVLALAFTVFASLGCACTSPGDRDISRREPCARPALLHPSRVCGAGYDVPCDGSGLPCDEDAGRHGR